MERSKKVPWKRLKIRLEWKPQDLWIGVFWKQVGNRRDPAQWFVHFHVWICILPCLPVHVTIEYQDAEPKF